MLLEIVACEGHAATSSAVVVRLCALLLHPPVTAAGRDHKARQVATGTLISVPLPMKEVQRRMVHERVSDWRCWPLSSDPGVEILAHIYRCGVKK